MDGNDLVRGARRQQTGLAFIGWEPDAEGGAPANVAFHFDASTVGAHDALHNHQAQPGALFLGGIERVKYPVDFLLGNAAARVRHAQPDAIRTLPSLQGEHSAFGHRL